MSFGQMEFKGPRLGTSQSDRFCVYDDHSRYVISLEASPHAPMACPVRVPLEVGVCANARCRYAMLMYHYVPW